MSTERGCVVRQNGCEKGDWRERWHLLGEKAANGRSSNYGQSNSPICAAVIGHRRNLPLIYGPLHYRAGISSAPGLIGLLALMATNYFQAIAFHRKQPTFSLTPVALPIITASAVCCFFAQEMPTLTPVALFTSILPDRHSLFQWTWNVNPPCDGRFLIAFWLTGALVFYTEQRIPHSAVQRNGCFGFYRLRPCINRRIYPQEIVFTIYGRHF
jgi:hypothetical protein